MILIVMYIHTLKILLIMDYHKMREGPSLIAYYCASNGVRYKEVPLVSVTSVITPCQPIQCWLNNLFCWPVSQVMKVKFFLAFDHVLPPLGTYTLSLIARCP